MQPENIVRGIMFAGMVNNYCKIFLTRHGCFPVTCGSNTDCSEIPGRGVCKQEKDGKTTCQPQSFCLCSDEEFCNLQGKCIRPGTTMEVIN